MERIVKLNGEGVMLRHPKSMYEQRRSDQLLKVKKFFDAEAKVIKSEKGTGRCANMMGKLVCRTVKDNIEFRVGSGFTDA